MKSSWRSADGVRYLHCDFSGFGFDTNALEEEVRAADALILAETPGSVLALADLTRTVTSSTVVGIFKDSAKKTQGHVVRQAVIGVSGIQKILAQSVARFSGQALVLFDDEESAKEWLVRGGQPAGTVLS